MKNTILIAFLDIKESFRSKWFLIYLLIFGGLVAAFFISGVTNSRVLGFSGLSRLLLLFIQVCIIILPIFILVSTVRAILQDKESNVLEYLLSFPINLREYYFGKALGRLFGIFVPVFLSLVLAVIWGVIKGVNVPWELFLLYSGLLFCLCISFLGIAFLISSLAKTAEIALALAFFVWLVALAFLDLLLIAILMKYQVDQNIIFAVALANPIEVFRIAAIGLFDPALAVIGPAAYFILDTFGRVNFLIFAHVYPIFLGILCLVLGFVVFCKKDLA
ncbi:ABC transporter permease [Campylobacter geochelonis]|uniref:ABC transporter permease n=1 Tax=Campylobacter geochelonis TaxID=1780362 RepID=UPI0007709F8A|nr:ABC transporter permease [Campylobacter geochelonis]CZE46015.1 ABC transporter [Campylobacter geochelonis]